jgi:hypothetical protein
MLGVVKDIPVPNEVPPEEAEYQFKMPALAVAPRITVPAPQRESGAVELTLGVVLTVAITSVLAEVHPLLVASTW